MDCGASRHMIFRRDFFINLEMIQPIRLVELGNNFYVVANE